jgi:hypothetical protein
MTTTSPEPTRGLRRFRPLLWWLAAWLALDITARCFHDIPARHSPDDYAERIQGCAKEPRDFVILGGSPVSEGLDPDLVAGFSLRGTPMTNGYAVGLPGGTTTDMYYAWRHATPTPAKVVIYGVSLSDMNDARSEPHGPYSIYTAHDMRDLVATRPEASFWNGKRYLEGNARQLSAIFRDRHGWQMAATELMGDTPEAAGLRRYAEALRNGRGYAPADFFVNKNYAERKRTGDSFAPFEFLNKYRLGSHAKYLPRMVAECETLGTQLVILLMPMTMDLETKYPVAMQAFRDDRATWNFPGVIILDAHRDAVKLDDDDFADIIHLNGQGAKKLSRWTHDALMRAKP